MIVQRTVKPWSSAAFKGNNRINYENKARFSSLDFADDNFLVDSLRKTASLCLSFFLVCASGEVGRCYNFWLSLAHFVVLFILFSGHFAFVVLFIAVTELL